MTDQKEVNASCIGKVCVQKSLMSKSNWLVPLHIFCACQNLGTSASQARQDSNRISSPLSKNLLTHDNLYSTETKNTMISYVIMILFYVSHKLVQNHLFSLGRGETLYLYLCLSVYGVVMPRVSFLGVSLWLCRAKGGLRTVMSHLCLRFDCIVCS